MADIYAYWLDKGVDGYRLDGVKYLAEYNGETENSEATHCYLQGMRRWFDAHYPDRMVVGEVWDSVDVIAPYFGDGQDELALAFDFGVSDGIYDAIIRHDASLLQVPFANREYYYPADGSYGAPFLRNHDMDRTGSVFTEPGQLELAAAIQLALNGTPFIYYGEELGMSGKRGSENNDNNRRSPMQWSPAPGGGFTCETCTPWFPLQSDYQTRNLETEEADPAGLIHWYRRLIEVRLAADNESLRRGDYTRVAATGSGAFAFLRGSGEGAVLVLINLNATALDGATFDLSKVGSWESGVDLLADEGEPASYSGLTGSFSAGTIPAYGIRWLRLSGYTAPNL
jgi:glycosidase